MHPGNIKMFLYAECVGTALLCASYMCVMGMLHLGSGQEQKLQSPEQYAV